MRLLFYYLAIYWFDQSKNKDSSCDLRMGAFFWYDFLFIFFHNINSMYNLIFGISSSLFLPWLYIIFIFEILMKNNILCAFLINFFILLTFLKPNRFLIHLTNILSKKDINLIFLVIQRKELNLIFWFYLFQIFQPTY